MITRQVATITRIQSLVANDIKLTALQEFNTRIF